jgi:hypothetical protein
VDVEGGLCKEGGQLLRPQEALLYDRVRRRRPEPASQCVCILSWTSSGFFKIMRKCNLLPTCRHAASAEKLLSFSKGCHWLYPLLNSSGSSKAQPSAAAVLRFYSAPTRPGLIKSSNRFYRNSEMCWEPTEALIGPSDKSISPRSSQISLSPLQGYMECRSLALCELPSANYCD